ncbi:hypothetical protein SDJN02_12715, partial [Cucurbita argyrosperma subsp. argyrosperma]
MNDSNEDQRLPLHGNPKEFVSMDQLAVELFWIRFVLLEMLESPFGPRLTDHKGSIQQGKSTSTPSLRKLERHSRLIKDLKLQGSWRSETRLSLENDQAAKIMKTHLGWEQYHYPIGAAKLKPAELGYNHASQLH